MKKSELRQIIREEINRVVSEARGSDSAFEFHKNPTAVKNAFQQDMKKHKLKYNTPHTIQTNVDIDKVWHGPFVPTETKDLKAGEDFSFMITNNHEILFLRPKKTLANQKYSAGIFNSIMLKLGDGSFKLVK